MTWLAIATTAVVVIAAAWAARRRRAAAPERQLERICRGDIAQASRLIAYELRRAPEISRQEAAIRAVESHRRDNS
jgi:hypothetical protein